MGASYLQVREIEAYIRYFGEFDMTFAPEYDHRNIGSIFIQDEIDIAHGLSFTAGLRYDHYDELDDKLTSRVALVKRVKDRHILKAQYAEGYTAIGFFYTGEGRRQDWWLEGMSDHEKNRTLELEYIFKGVRSETRISLFISRIKDLFSDSHAQTASNDPYQVTKIEEAETRGVEIEYRRQLTRSVKLDANLSYVSAKYLGENINPLEEEIGHNASADGEKIAGSSDWLGNLGVMWQPAEDISLAMQYRYVGKRHRWYLDEREALDPCHTVDATLSVARLFRDGLTLRLGVKNIFDGEVTYPAPHDFYAEDLPRAGREGWLQLRYQF